MYRFMFYRIMANHGRQRFVWPTEICLYLNYLNFFSMRMELWWSWLRCCCSTSIMIRVGVRTILTSFHRIKRGGWTVLTASVEPTHLYDGKWYFFLHTNFWGMTFGPAKTVWIMIIRPTETLADRDLFVFKLF